MLRRKTGGVGQSLLCKTLQLIRRFPTPPFLVSASLASSFAGKEIRVPKGIEANSTIFSSLAHIARRFVFQACSNQLPTSG